MEFLLIILVAVAILAYAFRVDQWDMWKDPKWETVEKWNGTVRRGNMFTSQTNQCITIVQVSTTLKEKKIRVRVNYGEGFETVPTEKLYIDVPDSRPILEKHGYKL